MTRVLSWDAADLWTEGLSSNDLKYKYHLASEINAFIAINEYGYRNAYEFVGDHSILELCSKKDENWLTQNYSILINKKKMCDSYPKWKEFEIENKAVFDVGGFTF